MFDKLKKLGKQDKEEVVEDFYSEEGNFGEFENVKVKEADKQEEAKYYEEVTIEEKKKKRNKTFIIIMGVLIMLLVVVLIIRGCVLKQGKLKAVAVEVPTIVYLGESTEITGNASGSGALWQTAYNFDTTNAGVAELEAKGQLTGKKVKNEIIPITTGRFAVVTKAKLGAIELETIEKQVIVCRRLTEESLTTKSIIIEEKATNRINLDVGTENECFSSLNYKIADESIARIDANGNITGIKEGTSVITISDGTSEVKETIEVISGEDLTRVKEIKLEATSETIKVGEEKAVKYTVLPETATNKNLIWATSNEGVVTVSSKGVLKGIGVGTSAVTITTEDKKVSKIIIVKVEPKATAQTPAKDATGPKLTSVKIYSNNEDKTKAKKGNVITLEVKANEKLGTKPSMYIAGKAVTVTCGAGTTPTCKGSYTVAKEDKAGAVTIKVVGYKDVTGNTGNQITTTTDKSRVAIYISEWGDLTATKCDTTDTYNCKIVEGYKYETRTRTSYACQSGTHQETQPRTFLGYSYSCSVGTMSGTQCVETNSCPSGYSANGYANCKTKTGSTCNGTCKHFIPDLSGYGGGTYTTYPVSGASYNVLNSKCTGLLASISNYTCNDTYSYMTLSCSSGAINATPGYGTLTCTYNRTKTSKGYSACPSGWVTSGTNCVRDVPNNGTCYNEGPWNLINYSEECTVKDANTQKCTAMTLYQTREN